MQEFADKPLRALVVWEPVLAADWFSPSTTTLGRIVDTRAAQFWDKGRLISRSLGEHDANSIVWDYIAVYPAGAVWQDRPPEAPYHGSPVIKVTEAARAAIAKALADHRGK